MIVLGVQAGIKNLDIGNFEIKLIIFITSKLTLRRPGRQAWRSGLFYGAPRSHLQVISKRRKMNPLEI